MVFSRPTDDATAELCIVDEHADDKIIKVLHDRKVIFINLFNVLCLHYYSKQKIDCMDLRISKNYAQSGYKIKVTEDYEVNFPMSFLYIIGKSPRSSCKMRVDGLRGVEQEFSLSYDIRISSYTCSQIYS